MLRLLPFLVAFIALRSNALAHRLDEYLQATIVVIETNEVRLQIHLTPGIEVAEQVLALIDPDLNGVISTNEAVAYSELLQNDLTVRLDQQDVQLRLTASAFPELAELRTGWGIIQMEYSLMSAGLAAGAHRLIMENRHLPALSIYLFNAARPGSDSIQVTRQRRNANQSIGEIEFTFLPRAKPLRAIELLASLIALLCLTVVGLRKARKRTACDPVRP